MNLIMISLTILKLSFLFIGILYTISNVGNLHYKNDISLGRIVLQTVGIFGFLIMQFELYK